MNSAHLEKYMSQVSVPNIHDFTPTVIEERSMNVVGMDVFSRLMMDRIIFMGVAVNDYVANVIQAQLLFLESLDPKGISRFLLIVLEVASLMALEYMTPCSMFLLRLGLYVQDWQLPWEQFYWLLEPKAKEPVCNTAG